MEKKILKNEQLKKINQPKIQNTKSDPIDF